MIWHLWHLWLGRQLVSLYLHDLRFNIRNWELNIQKILKNDPNISQTQIFHGGLGLPRRSKRSARRSSARSRATRKVLRIWPKSQSWGLNTSAFLGWIIVKEMFTKWKNELKISSELRILWSGIKCTFHIVLAPKLECWITTKWDRKNPTFTHRQTQVCYS